MSMAPDEICRRFGETRFKEMFGAMNALTMKRVLQEAGISTVRQPSHTSTKKRNEDWANRLWRLTGQGAQRGYTALFQQWLVTQRNVLLCTYLDALGVKHQSGLTDEDFLNDRPEVLLQEEAKKLLDDARFDRRDVAAYLLFLDYSNQTERFASLNLETLLSAS